MSKKLFLSFIVFTTFIFLSSKNIPIKVKAVTAPPTCKFPQVICNDSPDNCHTICDSESNNPTPTKPRPTISPIEPTIIKPQFCQKKPACFSSPHPCRRSEPSGGWCQSADFDLDGNVDQEDYNFMNEKFLKRGANDLMADINNDGRVDLKDYSILITQRYNIKINKEYVK